MPYRAYNVLQDIQNYACTSILAENVGLNKECVLFSIVHSSRQKCWTRSRMCIYTLFVYYTLLCTITGTNVGLNQECVFIL